MAQSPRPGTRPTGWTDESTNQNGQTRIYISPEEPATPLRPQPFRAYHSDSIRPSELRPHSPSSSPVLASFKQPARSFFHSSYHSVNANVITDAVHQPTHAIRDQTAELATYALSEAANSYQNRFSPSLLASPLSNGSIGEPASFTLPAPILRPPTSTTHPDCGLITEVSEPVSPDASPNKDNKRTSYLTYLLKTSPPETSYEQSDNFDTNGEIHQRPPQSPVPNERMSLLNEARRRSFSHMRYDAISNGQERHHHTDFESQNGHDIGNSLKSRIKSALAWRKVRRLDFANTIFNKDGGRLDKRKLWKNVVIKPVGYIPAVILGLLLNVLDGLSYGMILFPLGQAIFSDLGADGLSMFYVSCIISQLVYSCGGSVFKGGVGSEMIEVVPFFHKMAFTILTRVGEGNAKAVLATTILAFSLSSIITGLVFFLLGYLKLGSLASFFPRHILLGCIGGVGWFLVATGIEVSARLDGSLTYDLDTLYHLLEPSTLVLWVIPLLLAITLTVLKIFFRYHLLDAFFFISVLSLFYLIVIAVPQLDFPLLREKGWVFERPPAGVPFWHFYTLYDFKETNWEALLHTVPAMFALTFFGILHVPINVPALGVSTGEDNLDVDRELIAHGVSNALSGLCGSIQNYLVYTNSVLFIRSGGDSRVAGVMLAVGTIGIWMSGPVIIGYIPVMVVGSLIFYLGMELLREALYDTWRKVHRLEYLTIIAIVVTMGGWDFVIGILIGIVLACVSYVVQTSQKSPIRGTYTGVVARSTVRRHPIQQRFLQQVGGQIFVMKLTGYMFFGTITSVERSIRDVLMDYNFQRRPIRYLIVDLSHATGIDFSAAEAFTRIRRQVVTRNVELILCGVESSSEVGKALQSVGIWSNTADGVEIFIDLNGALEACENELLSTFYRQKDFFNQENNGTTSLEVPNDNRSHTNFDAVFNSPRRNFVYQAAASALTDYMLVPTRWQNFKQPLPLILQIFQEMTDKNEDFWFKVCPYFKRMEFPEGSIIFTRGAKPEGFYLLEQGMFRADYDLEQGQFSESIVAGTTCGELPFFSDTSRTATVVAEKASVAWVLDRENWLNLQEKHPDVGYELLKICLKLTTERLSAITSYILTTSG
ncbi:sulfate transporter family-domain-containing protein [Kalaharituber pfeilii]|nr:sulfate transporter family-domain-containing protein [Kalaharituber pfeilii]